MSQDYWPTALKVFCTFWGVNGAHAILDPRSAFEAWKLAYGSVNEATVLVQKVNCFNSIAFSSFLLSQLLLDASTIKATGYASAVYAAGMLEQILIGSKKVGNPTGPVIIWFLFFSAVSYITLTA